MDGSRSGPSQAEERMMASTDDVLVADVAPWRGLVRTGAWAALASVAMIVPQIGIYVIWPPPQTTAEFYEVLAADPVRGVLALDVLYVVSNLLAFLAYLALAVVLWRVSRSAVVVEMLVLARSYADAEPAEQVALLATGDGMLATWMGTAFDVYYFFNLATLLIFAVLIFRSAVFSRPVAWWGLVAAVLMAVPSNFGAVGLAFALASLVPWSVFAVLAARRLLALAAPEGEGSEAR